MKDGGPAFPVRISSPEDGRLATDGMSIRDYFAAAALVHWYTHGDDTNYQAGKAAAWAYQLADAMIAEREKP